MEDDELSQELKAVCATRLQSMIRRFLSRCKAIKILNNRFEKILDVKRKKYYYYDTLLDESCWSKPALLRHHDLVQVAQPYDKLTAAIMIQRQARRVRALIRVRQLYSSVIVQAYDESYAAEYYYNSYTGVSMWYLPSFMSDRRPYIKPEDLVRDDDDNYEDEEGRGDDGDAMGLEEASLEESSIEGIIRERRYPRSRAQQLIDGAEDEGKPTALDLSHLGAEKLSSRVYDLISLKSLDLSHNKLSELSTDLQYLLRLRELDVSHNLIETVPVELEDLRRIEVFRAAHNKLSTLPGHFFKLREMRELDLSHNAFTVFPMEVGSLELLKVHTTSPSAAPTLVNHEMRRSCASGRSPSECSRSSRRC